MYRLNNLPLSLVIRDYDNFWPAPNSRLLIKHKVKPARNLTTTYTTAEVYVSYLSTASLQYEPIQPPESSLQFLECQILQAPVLHRSCTAAAMPRDIWLRLCPWWPAPNHQLQYTVQQSLSPMYKQLLIGCAIMPALCWRHKQSMGNQWQILTPYKIKTHEPTATKCGTTDYICEKTPKPNLIQSIAWDLLGKWVKYNVFCAFLFIHFYLYSLTHLQVRLIDGFLYAIAIKDMKSCKARK